jgi:hypothetical protein
VWVLGGDGLGGRGRGRGRGHGRGHGSESAHFLHVLSQPSSLEKQIQKLTVTIVVVRF